MRLRLDSDDPEVNFKKIEDVSRQSPMLHGTFEFRSIELKELGTAVKYKHNLAFIPKDFIITRGSATISTVTEPDDTFIYFNVSAPTTVRIVYGSWEA